MESWLSEHGHELRFTTLPFRDRFEMLRGTPRVIGSRFHRSTTGCRTCSSRPRRWGSRWWPRAPVGWRTCSRTAAPALMFEPGDEAGCMWALHRAAALEAAERAAMGAACRCSPRPSSTPHRKQADTSTRCSRPRRLRPGELGERGATPLSETDGGPLLRARRRARPPDARPEGPRCARLPRTCRVTDRLAVRPRSSRQRGAPGDRRAGAAAQ